MLSFLFYASSLSNIEEICSSSCEVVVLKRKSNIDSPVSSKMDWIQNDTDLS